MFLRRLFTLLAKMASADGRIDPWETHAAEGAFARFPRAAARRKFCARAFNEGKKARLSIYRLAWDFSDKWARPEDSLAVYGLLWDVACAKGVLKPAQKEILRSICRCLNLPEGYFGIFFRRHAETCREWTREDEERENAERRRGEEARGGGQRRRSEENRSERPPAGHPLQAEYDLLGCRPTDPDETVKRAYRLAAKKHHPDVLRASGRKEEEIRRATETMARINAAWDRIKTARGL